MQYSFDRDKAFKISSLSIKLSIDFVYLYIVLTESEMIKLTDLKIRIGERRTARWSKFSFKLQAANDKIVRFQGKK